MHTLFTTGIPIYIFLISMKSFLLQWTSYLLDEVSVENQFVLPCPHALLYSTQSHLLTLVRYPSRSACHPLLLHAVCGPGPVPQVPKPALPGVVPLLDHHKVLLSEMYNPQSPWLRRERKRQRKGGSVYMQY